MIDPSKRAGPGDILVVECPTRNVGLTQRRSRDYFEAWMIKPGKVALEAAPDPVSGVRKPVRSRRPGQLDVSVASSPMQPRGTGKREGYGTT